MMIANWTPDEFVHLPAHGDGQHVVRHRGENASEPEVHERRVS
jgi:hypothetical protein